MPATATIPTATGMISNTKEGFPRHKVALNVEGINHLQTGTLIPQKRAVSGDDDGTEMGRAADALRLSKRSRKTPKPRDHDVPSPTNVKRGRK